MKYQLGDICDIVKGDTGLMKAVSGRYEMVTTGEVNKTHNQFQFDTKAAIIPLVSSTGHGHASMKRVKYVEGKFALGNILCAVIPKDENFVLAKYLHIYLHWNREELLVSQMKGMANVSLSLSKIADVEVIVPGINKQKEIVDLEKKLVTKELEAESLLSDQLTQIENLNQAILQEAVQGKLVPQNTKDEPASELLKRIKAEKAKLGKKEKLLPPIKPEEIPFDIPDSWVWCRLGEIALSISTGPFGTMLHQSDYVKKGIPLVNPTNIVNGKIIASEKATVNEQTLQRLKTYVLKTDDVVIGRRGEMGRCAVVTENENGWLCGTGSFFLRLHSDIYRPFFVKVLGSEFAKSILLSGSVGATMNNLNHRILSNLPIPLPPLPEQKRIVAEIEKQLAKTKQLKEHIIANQQATEQLLKALLHQAFEVEKMEEV